jgi:hypothetical protein
MNLSFLTSTLQIIIPCSGAEDLEAAQKVLMIMYSRQLDLENSAPQLAGSPLIKVQLLAKVRSWSDIPQFFSYLSF